MNKLEWALKAGRDGFLVHPLQENGKKPILKNWNSLASNNEEQIKLWWTKFPDANIGVHCKGLCVVDIDVKLKDKDGRLQIDVWKKESKLLPKTSIQKTTSGGFHIIYKVENDIANKVELYPGVDIRGLNGFIVFEGSTLDGKVYTRTNTPLVNAPEWLLSELSLARPKVQSVDLKPIKVDKNRAEIKFIEHIKNNPCKEGGRNNKLNALNFKAQTLGLTHEEAFPLILEHWDCDPPLEMDEIKTTIRPLPVQLGVDSPEAHFEAVSESKEVSPIEELNKNYALVIAGGKHHILHETTNERGEFDLEHLQVETFHVKLNAQMLQRDGQKPIPLTKEWYVHPKRRSYDKLIFAPDVKHDSRFYNLWRGFAVKELAEGEEPTYKMKRALELFLEHIRENICGNDLQGYEWVISWFADMVQNPGIKPGVALVLRGSKGTGKTIVFDILKGLFPSNYFITAERRYLLGQFNSHLENKILFVLDEAFWSGDKEAEGKLKALITSKDLEIERKGIDTYSVNSYFRIAVLGNEDWVIPATEDERRFTVFDVGNERRQDQKFFSEMYDSMIDGGIRYLFTYLKNYKIKMNIRKAYETEALYQQIQESLDPERMFWFECLARGYIVENGERNWPECMSLRLFMDNLGNYLKDRNVRSRGKSHLKTKETLKKMNPEIISDAADIHFPNLQASRDAWDNYIGRKTDWKNV